MPSPFELEQSALGELSPQALGQQAFAQQGALQELAEGPQPTFLESAAGGIGDFFTGLFDFGTGALTGLFDVADRPGRAVRQLIGGDPGQALAALLPDFAAEGLGLEASQPIGFKDILEHAGILEQDSGFFGTAVGFLGDLVFDPLTYLGAPLGRVVSNGSRRIAARIAQVNADLAAKTTPVLSTLARGLQRTGTAVGDAFVKDFQLQRGVRSSVLARGGTLDEADDALRSLQAKRTEIIADAQSQELQSLSIAQQVQELVDRDARKILNDLREVPEFEERFLIRRAGADPGQFQVVGTAPEREAARLRLGVTDEVLTEVIDDLPPNEVKALTLMLSGDPAFARARSKLPGSRGVVGEIEDVRSATSPRGRTEQLIDLDHLQRDKIEELFRRVGVAHVGHFRNTKEVENILDDALRELVPDAAKITDNQILVDRARRLAALNREGAEALQLRKLVGSLNEIEEVTGKQLFVRDVAEEFFLSSKRFIAVKSSDDMATHLLGLSDVSKVSATTIDAATLPPGFRNVPLEELPRSVRNKLEKAGTPHVAMQTEVAKEMFGKGGLITNLTNLQGAGLLNVLRQFNRVYKPWTLAHPGSITRDGFGDVVLNTMAGVGPQWYAKTAPVYTALRNRRLGKEVTGSIKLGDRTIPMNDIVDELIDTGLPGHSLMHTEFYNIQSEILENGPLKRAFHWDPGQNTWVRTLMDAKGQISDRSRIAHYLQKRYVGTDGKGMPMFDAMMSAKKNLYDAENLTNFERNVMREIFPFYSWARQNIPNMVRKSIEGTAFVSTKWGELGPNIPLIIGRTKINLDAELRADVPEELLPTWLQGQLTIPIGRDKDGQLSLFALNTWLPIADLTEIDSPKKFMKFAFNSMTPLATEPIEQFFNWDAYFESAIEKYPGETEQFLGFPLQKRVARVLRNARLLNELDRTFLPLINKTFGLEIGTGTERMRDFLGQQEWGELFARATAGVKIRDVDLQRSQQFLLKRVQREMRGLASRLRFARRDGDFANVRQIQRLLARKRELLNVAVGFNPVENPNLGALTESDMFRKP